MASGGIPLLGSKMSIISKARIRYEGLLYAVDPNDYTVALSKVRSFGTESRDVERYVAPTPEMYEYIIFRGNDIEEMEVCADQPHAHPLPNDPAIVSSQLASTNSGSGGMQSSNSPRSSSGNMAPAPPQKPVSQTQQATSPPPPMHIPQHMGHHQQHGEAWGGSSDKAVGNDSGGQQHTSPVRRQQQRQQQSQFEIQIPIDLPGGNDEYRFVAGGGGQSQGGYRGNNNQFAAWKSYRERDDEDYGHGSGGGGYAFQQQWRPFGHYHRRRRPINRGGAYHRGGFERRPYHYDGWQPPFRPARGGGRGGAAGGGVKTGVDFDFDEAQKRFTQLEMENDKEVTLVSDLEKVEGEDESQGPSSTKSGDDDEDKQAMYDKSKSFFDNISCESNDKEKRRPNWREEAKTNTETFGRAGYRRPRGGYYRGPPGRGYGYGRGYYNYGPPRGYYMGGMQRGYSRGGSRGRGGGGGVASSGPPRVESKAS